MTTADASCVSVSETSVRIGIVIEPKHGRRKVGRPICRWISTYGELHQRLAAAKLNGCLASGLSTGWVAKRVATIHCGFCTLAGIDFPALRNTNVLG